MGEINIHKLADFVRRIKADYERGNITREEHDKILQERNVDPYTYEYKPDSVDLSSTKEAGKKLSASSGGTTKAKEEKPVKEADFVKRIKADYERGNITREEYDKILNAYGCKPDSEEKPVKEAEPSFTLTPKQLKELDQYGKQIEDALKAGTNAVSGGGTKAITPGIPMGIEETQTVKARTGSFPNTFGPGNPEGLKDYPGMLNIATGQ